jgi:hypothetical protein
MELDKDQHLILVWNKIGNEFEDKTTSIRSIETANQGFNITFASLFGHRSHRYGQGV